MKIGLALPHYDFSAPDGAPVSWDRLADAARRAELLGFDSVWVSDHFFLTLERYGGGRDDMYGSPEALTAVAAIAAITERVRLGTLVLCAGFRHPALLAKSAVTVDLLSEGRLDLGLGAGWLEKEYRAFGYDFGDLDHRFEILEETLVALGLLFGEGPATWEGRHFTLHEAYARPRPAQEPRPPLWVGGKGGPRILRLVARHADGWNTAWTWTPAGYAERARALDRACEREGRDPSTVRRSVGLYTLVGEDRNDLAARYRALQAWMPGGSLDGQSLTDWGRDKLVGTPEQILDRIGAFAEHGAGEIICSLAALPFGLYEESAMDVLAETVMPAARKLEPSR